jgi:TRAP-type C4-dicarboxylate transport system substrate-binding protein
MPTRRFAILLTISVLAPGVGACGGNASDKAGGAVRNRPVVLRLADGVGDVTLAQVYADEVARRSHGSLRIEVQPNWRRLQIRREEETVNDVKAGRADIGFDATRGFADTGVTSFDALHAPLLMDSLALEAKVLRSPLAAEMLNGLEPLGVVGLGILPGPLRRPLGLARRLVRPSDYRGQTVGLVRSRVGTATLRALGASPRTVPAGAPIDGFGLDGLESDLATLELNRFDQNARAITSNITLWARPEVLYINQQAFARLRPAQREILRAAAPAALAPALLSLSSRQADAATLLCGRGLWFTAADPSDVAALRAAVRPVYADFDARTNRFVDQIRAMARDVQAEPTPVCTTSEAPPPIAPKLGTKTPLDGTYLMRISRAQARQASGGQRPVDENYGEFRTVLDRGHFHMTQKGGRSDRWTRGVYAVDGDRLTITIQQSGGVRPNGADEKPGEVFEYRWSLYRQQLSMRPAHPEPGGYPAQTMTRTGDAR